jgi:hypothetical protein
MVEKKEVDLEREKEKENPVKVVTVPGTRSFHHFIPLSVMFYQILPLSYSITKKVINRNF